MRWAYLGALDPHPVGAEQREHAARGGLDDGGGGVRVALPPLLRRGRRQDRLAHVRQAALGEALELCVARAGELLQPHHLVRVRVRVRVGAGAGAGAGVRVRVRVRARVKG